MKLVLFLYNLIYIILLPVAFIVYSIIVKIKAGEKGYIERFGLIKLNKAPRSKSIWFHCASVGEVRSISNIVDNIRKKYSDVDIIVSTMTTTGRKEAKEYIKADEAFLLPIENSSAISHIIKLLGVKVFFIVDTEIWPNLIYSAGSNSRLIMINGKISEKSFKTYYRFRLFFAPLFNKFSAILTKSIQDYERFVKITKNNKKIAPLGNIKFNQIKKVEDIKLIDKFKNIKYAFAASTHNNEEEIFIDGFIDGGKDFDKAIIAPRHIVRCDEIVEMVKNKGLTVSKYSEDIDSKVVVIDSFGLLESLYVSATKIFIGGSIVNIGGHNIFEALQFEKQIAVGNNMQDFAEIYEPAKKYNLVENVNSSQDIAIWLQKEYDKKDFSNFFEEINNKNKNITETIEELINDVLSC